MAFSDRIKGAVASRLAKSKSKELTDVANRLAKATDKNPEVYAAQYAAARKSMLGEFSTNPVRPCQECLTSAKASRRKERLELVGRAIVTCPEHADAAVRLRKDMDEVENMRCAKHVYLANDERAPPELRDNPPPGFKMATTEDLAAMGLQKWQLEPEGSGFRAAVYMKDPAVWGENPSPASVVAFRGSTPAIKDWENNFNQDANKEAPYYRAAVDIGNTLAKEGADAHIVGHSLGGGLASAAQGGSGLTASTYNASGLHPNTVAKYSNDTKNMAANADKITAFRVKGEVLTKTQESAWGTSWVANQGGGHPARSGTRPRRPAPCRAQEGRCCGQGRKIRQLSSWNG